MKFAFLNLKANFILLFFLLYLSHSAKVQMSKYRLRSAFCFFSFSFIHLTKDHCSLIWLLIARNIISRKSLNESEQAQFFHRIFFFNKQKFHFCLAMSVWTVRITVLLQIFQYDANSKVNRKMWIIKSYSFRFVAL